MCGQPTAYNAYATLPYTNPLFMGFSRSQNVNREIHDSYGGKNYDLVLCHYPIFSWKGMNKGTILLYGHTHNSAEDVYFQKCLAGMEANNCRHVGDKPIQAYNVGCMKPWIDYEPRSLKEIIEKYHNIK